MKSHENTSTTHLLPSKTGIQNLCHFLETLEGGLPEQLAVFWEPIEDPVEVAFLQCVVLAFGARDDSVRAAPVLHKNADFPKEPALVERGHHARASRGQHVDFAAWV